jgi:hypothetical protein
MPDGGNDEGVGGDVYAVEEGYFVSYLLKGSIAYFPCTCPEPIYIGVSPHDRSSY